MAATKLLIVTGLSGAGKTQAVRCLEDLGFFCVDNLPPKLISKFAELCAQTTGKVERIALVIDIRGGEFFDTVLEVLADLKQQSIRHEILYLEASNEALVRRFKESRRPHPLSASGEIMEGIKAERQALRDMRGLAHKIIDTSGFSVTQLKQEIVDLYGGDGGREHLAITNVSFGYKYGIPLDADLVIDVRFLPNPHYIPELRPLTGLDESIRKYVFDSPTTREFLAHLENMFNFLIPQYVREGKATLTLAIGCTGGRHRSVALAEWLGERLRKRQHRITVRHRDLNREG
jgi:UPF0042 nucleotide-binding protein